MIIVSTDKRQRPPPYHERPFNSTPFRFSQVCCYSCLCAYASLLASFQTLGFPASTFRRGPPIRSKIGPLLGEGIEGNSDFWESLLLPPVVTDYKTSLSAQPHAGRVRWIRLLACAEPSFASLCCLVQPSFPPPPAPYYLGPTSRLSAISEIVDDQTLLSTPRASGVDNVIEYLEYQEQAEAEGQQQQQRAIMSNWRNRFCK